MLPLLTLASLLEDGTFLFARYVAENPRFRSEVFEVLGETDVYQQASATELMSVEILKGASRISLEDNKAVNFGGEYFASAKGTQKGWVRLSKIKAPGRGEGRIHQVLSMVNLGETIRSLDHPVLLKVGPLGFSNVTDAQVLSDNKVAVKDKNQVVLWLAQKPPGGAPAIEEYCLVSDRGSPNLFQHKEVQDFMEIVSGFLSESQGQMEVTFWRPIRDGQLAAMGLYGPGFGSRSPGPDNIQALGQGDIILTSEDDGNTFDLVFSERTWISPDLSQLDGAYEPVLAARINRGATRGFRYKGQEYPDARLVICPFDRVRTRDCQQI